jgi:hypothetical protein
MGKNFFCKIPKAQETKEKIDHWNYIILKATAQQRKQLPK